MSHRSIARASGVPHSTIVYIEQGKHRRGIPRNVEKALLAVKPVSYDRMGGLVPSRPSQRRLGALMTMGWTLAELGRRYGVNNQVLARVFTQDRIQSRTAARISVMYDDLSGRFPDKPTAHFSTAAKKAQLWAMERGFKPPMYWEGRDITATDYGGRFTITAPSDPRARSRLNDVEEILQDHPLYTIGQVAETLGITYGGLHTLLRRSDRDDLRKRFKENGRLAMRQNAYNTHRKRRGTF